MNIKIIILLSLILSGCGSVRLGWIDENSYETEQSDSILPDDIGPLGGHFDEDDKWIPDDEDIVLTYKIPDISAGFIFDARTLEVSPSISIELFEFDTHIPYVRRLKFDAGVAHQRTFGYVGKLWTSIFEISTGAFIGWNWKEQELSYGAALLIIKF